MRFLRRIKGCTKIDRSKHEGIRHDLNIYNYAFNDKIEEYRTKWKQPIDRTPKERITDQILQYKPKSRRSTGCPRKQWSDV